MRYKLACTKCGRTYKPEEIIFRCKACESILEAKIDYGRLTLGKNFWKQKISQSKYSPFFPIESELATLGEGGTRLMKLRDKTFEDNSTQVYLKVETTNPTRSFKDRGSAVEITKTIEFGYRSICCASTGNMGISLATYSKKNGIDCTVFIGKGANRQKMRMIQKAGARLVKVNGDFNKATFLAERYGTENNVFVCGDYHYRKEGQKGVVLETMEQLKFDVPDYIFIQVGNATLIAAIYKGLKELMMLGKIKQMPKLIAVQATGCNPLVRAYRKHKQIKHVSGKTIADAIEVGYPTFGDEGLEAIIKTHGSAINVSDLQIKRSMLRLNRNFGVGSEPGGAAGFAGFISMYENQMDIFRDKRVGIIVTGDN